MLCSCLGGLVAVVDHVSLIEVCALAICANVSRFKAPRMAVMSNYGSCVSFLVLAWSESDVQKSNAVLSINIQELQTRHKETPSQSRPNLAALREDLEG